MRPLALVALPFKALIAIPWCIGLNCLGWLLDKKAEVFTLAVTVGISLLYLSGCAHQKGLETPGIVKMYEADTIVLYYNSREHQQAACGKILAGGRTDAGLIWHKDGTDSNGGRAAACSSFDPKRKNYPFHIYLWVQEAFRRSHEECHVNIWRTYGLFGNHSVCKDYGYDKPRKRL